MEVEGDLDRFWDAALDGDEIDREALLEEGDAELAGAVLTLQILERAATTWREPARPTQLGHFEILGDLGAGGLGRVYLGWDSKLLRHVAIKVIARDRWAINEARAIARLDHRSVVKVHEVGHDRLVMELLDGGSLQDKIEAMAAGESTHLDDLRARLHCLVRLAEGLAYCHERGILHRDVKPGNVLFAKDDDHPRWMDFGLAHLDELESLDITQHLVGTPAYLAPEQVEAGETGTDSRSDIFSFGVLAYELLTLTCPFKRDTRTATMEAVANARPAALRTYAKTTPRSVEHIVEHCLELHPEDRYQSMADLVGDLRNALADRPISVGGRSITHRSKLLYRRNRRVTHFALTGVALALAFAGTMWARSASHERAEVRQELRDIESELATLDHPDEFYVAAFRLAGLKTQSQLLDRRVIGTALFGRTLIDADAVIQEWSSRVGSIIREIEAPEEIEYAPVAWKPLLVIDNEFLPDNESNRDLRDRGRIFLSEELRQDPNFVLLKQLHRGTGYDAAFMVFRPTRFEEYPTDGYYRAQVPGVWEREFLVTSAWQAPIHLEVQSHRLSTEGWIALPEFGVIASPPITRGQYAEFCKATGRTEDKGASHKMSEPSGRSWYEAFEYAEWVGGRLPAGVEVAALVQATGHPDSEHLYGEFISDTFDLSRLEIASLMRYDRLLASPTPPLRVCAENGGRRHASSSDDKVGGFRILYPLTTR